MPEPTDNEPTLVRVTLVLCSMCLAGKSGQCHTPGCALWMNRAPDIPIADHCESFEPLEASDATQPDQTRSAASGFESRGETVTVTKLSTGWYHLRGVGPCNWAQPASWPCEPDALDASFFPEASRAFREAVRAENESLLEADRG